MKTDFAKSTKLEVHERRRKHVRFAGLTIGFVFALTASAVAAGFNVNPDVTFVPLPSTYRTVNDTTGCPAGFAGKFSFSALLTNKPTSPAMPGVTVRVVTLSNGNLLLDPQSNTILGGAGAEMSVPKTGLYADGLLSPDESVQTPFVLCLKTLSAFQFFVDVFGVVTQLVSVNQAGSGANDVLGNFPDHRISADGRFVAFVSVINDLAPNDTNGGLDVFLRDVQNKTTALVSVNRFGTNGGNAASGSPSLSADARYVAFGSDSTDLVEAQCRGVFRRDMTTGTTIRVSVDRTGNNCGNGVSLLPSMSADGRFVAFLSDSTDLLPNDTTGGQIYVRDILTGTTVLASINIAGTGGGNDGSGPPVISADGRFVAFSSLASDLVSKDTNGARDVFVRDLQLGTTILASVNRFGTDSGNGQSGRVPLATGFSFSANGRFIAYESTATDLVAIPSSGVGDVYVRDLQAGVTSLVSVNQAGTAGGNGSLPSHTPSISADGRFVAFESFSTDLVTTPTSGQENVFVRDLQTGATSLVSVNRDGTASGNSFSFEGVISANGRFIAFSSRASNLVSTPPDTNGGAPIGSSETTDVFVRDLQTSTTQMISVNRLGTDSANAGAGGALINADGRFVAFSSQSSDLVSADANTGPDVFIRPVQ